MTEPAVNQPEHREIGSRKLLILVMLAIILIGAVIISLVSGAYNIRAVDVGRTLAARLLPFIDEASISRVQHTVIWNLRLPRVLLCIAVGTALASAGAVFQGCFRNPLVEPYILGISSGAAFGAALGIIFPSMWLSSQNLAFVFSAVAVGGAYSLGRVQGATSVVSLILSGIIIGSVFSSLVGILKYIAHDAALREIVFWLMGGFYYATWKDVQVVVPVSLICFIIVWFHAWKLNVLSLGDEEARSLGVHPEYFKLLFILLATLMTAISVAAVGVIAWVGLMTPHAARMLIGPDHRCLLPAAALLGAVYLLVCDTLSRTLTAAEIPIGILTSLLGAPYLFYLLRAKGRETFGG